MNLYINFPSWLKPEIIPGLPFRWYGLMYLVAFVITYFLFVYQVRNRKLEISNDQIMNFFFWAIIGLLLGARLLAALVYDPTGMYLRKPWLIFWPFDENWNFTGLQGMSYHGGLIGAVIACVIFGYIKKIDLAEWGDMLVTAIPLGYTFGRLANFINGELYGRVTASPFGMIFPKARRFPITEDWVAEMTEKTGVPVEDGFVNLPRHPSQLYEAFFEGIGLWLIMWFIFRKNKPFKGFMIGLYIIGYGFFRFLIEYVRQPDEGLGFVIKLKPSLDNYYRFQTLLNFTTGQVLNSLQILAGVITILIFWKLHQKRNQVETYDQDTKKKNMRKLRKKLK
jgi:phosphatidylglycerol:prolipoprotein diacylglycerol transferase